MPNFWSKAGQFISEKISGSRTKDEDIVKVCEKMKNTEKGLSSLKLVLQNFLSYFDHFSKYFTDINSAMKLIYQDSPFYNFTEEIICKHQRIQLELGEMQKKMNTLLSKTSEWSIIFNSAKEQIKIREEKRKVYDHYESKLSKINKNNNSQKKDLKYIERNEGKFSKAASEYVEISELAFNTINNSLKLAWELTNQIIDGILTNEKVFFEEISKSLSWFKNSKERFLEMKNNIDNPNINKNTLYDPMKYMGEKSLMLKISMNRRNKSPCLSPKKIKIYRIMEEEGDSTRRKSNNLVLHKNFKKGEKKNQNVFENYSNIYIKSRITKSFGMLNEDKLNEFYKIVDDFS